MEGQYSQGLLTNTKQVIHSLLVSSPNKVTIEKLMQEYINIEGRPVPYASLGYKSLEHFLRSLPDIVYDQRIFDVDYPQSAVRLNVKLPQRDIAELNEQDRIVVQVVMVESPYCFNIWIKDKQFEEHKAMWNSMQQFYNSEDSKYQMPTSLIMPGHLCVVRSHVGAWERAEIIKFQLGSGNEVKVKLVDTGEALAVPHTQIMYLKNDYAILPGLFVRARMAWIAPWQGTVWSLAATKYFTLLVSYRHLYGKIEKIDNTQDVNTLYLVLVDSNLEEVRKNVNADFIESRYARRRCSP
ncbi:tudor domain-containing protein 5 isoform X2 [Scaptodrosophila lebanonensis]|uniref:Tudor domain-containing protein 5 isoform X2 n=1 Tax=Drosophila lebanonensis TaxID=7225 RepID=A0A6J2ULN7_DROLE|nr:tudor domain-containing protein 5 isoform X2 [Scaptodrosophila lebanonensis]